MLIKTQFSRKVRDNKGSFSKPYPIPDQIAQTLSYFRPKWSNSISHFSLKQLESHTLWRCTYLSNFYKGVTPPVLAITHLRRFHFCLVSNFDLSHSDQFLIPEPLFTLTILEHQRSLFAGREIKLKLIKAGGYSVIWLWWGSLFSVQMVGSSNGRRVVIFNEGLEVFSFSIMKSPFCFTDVEIIAVPATGFVNYFRFLRTIQGVLVWKERFDAAIILKNYLQVDKRIEIVYIWFEALRDLVALGGNHFEAEAFEDRQEQIAARKHTSAIADHVKSTGHNIKWDHFNIVDPRTEASF